MDVDKEVESIRRILVKADTEVKRLQELADMSTGKIMEVKDVNGAFSRCMWKIDGYAKENRWGPKETYDVIAKRARADYDAKFEEAKKIHEENLPAIENNKLVEKNIRATMENLGITATYSVYEYKTKRHRNKEWIRHTSGFVEDIRRCCKTGDSFSVVESEYKRKLEALEKWIKEQKKKADEEAKEAVKKEDEVIREKLRAFLAAKYDLPFDISLRDILYHFTKTDKYLDLALAMEQTRNDWSAGHYRVEYALDRFRVNLDGKYDNAIQDDVGTYLDPDDPDGRVFEESLWNYNEIYKLVDPGIYKDYLKIVDSAYNVVFI